MKLFGKSAALMNMVNPLFFLLGNKGNLQSLRQNIFPVCLNKGALVSCAINRTRHREGFTPIALHPNVRVNSRMLPPGTEIVLRSFTAENITVTNVL